VETRDHVRRVGIVGRVTEWKGQHVFLEAVAQAFRSRPVEAVVIGAPLFGEDAYADRIRRQAAELDGAVTFRGFVDDVPSELAQLDLLVHASIIPEPFGQVVLEGMAAGLPVAAANAGGPAEVIDDGIDGLLYPPGDADALADRLQLLAGDRELRLRLGRAARESAAEFSPQSVAAKVLGVYRNALDDRDRGSAAG
jgi:glycosyltransferase involved in cell wall biosynthesis